MRASFHTPGSFVLSTRYGLCVCVGGCGCVGVGVGVCRCGCAGVGVLVHRYVFVHG